MNSEQTEAKIRDVIVKTCRKHGIKAVIEFDEEEDGSNMFSARFDHTWGKQRDIFLAVFAVWISGASFVVATKLGFPDPDFSFACYFLSMASCVVSYFIRTPTEKERAALVIFALLEAGYDAKLVDGRMVIAT